MLIHGNNLEQLPKLADASIDAIITDPPYELGFMGKTWDSTGIAYNVELWRECLRVLKPGGHLLAFGGSRTYHRLACAIEDAGFDIRDQIMWVYGSGFPKSLDVSKAIDKRRDDRADVLVVTAEIGRLRDLAGLTNRDLDEMFGFAGMAGHWTSVKSQPTVPTVEQWTILREILRPQRWLDDEVWRLNGRKGMPGEAWADREVIGRGSSAIANKDEGPRHTVGASKAVEFDITAPATDAAKQWQGWGTALKPAHEPIVLARKPLNGTVAANVLQHSTGALNIDDCRVGDEVLPEQKAGQAKLGTFERRNMITPERSGRWPANFIHDGSNEVLELFPDSKGGAYPAKRGQAINTTFASGQETEGGFRKMGDEGSAARFFYCAKASRSERNAGLDNFQPKRDADRNTDTGGDNPRNQTNTPKQNHHPTVKPVTLMRYLARLITPPGGTILDPFTGSGTTGIAATLEHFEFIGIELDPEYVTIAEARIQHAYTQRH